MVDERVGGEAALGQPGAVQPVAVECPFEETGLGGTDQGSSEDGDNDQVASPGWSRGGRITPGPTSDHGCRTLDPREGAPTKNAQGGLGGGRKPRGPPKKNQKKCKKRGGRRGTTRKR